ncbi:MAG: hypothetical protein ACOC1F_14665, partial [Myxococcota bacterium]
FDSSTSRIALSDVVPLPAEIERVRTVDGGLELGRIAGALERQGRIPLPVDPFAIPKGLAHSVELLSSDDGPDVQLEVGDAQVERVVPTRTGLAALVQVRGKATVVFR